MGVLETWELWVASSGAQFALLGNSGHETSRAGFWTLPDLEGDEQEGAGPMGPPAHRPPGSWGCSVAEAQLGQLLMAPVAAQALFFIKPSSWPAAELCLPLPCSFLWQRAAFLERCFGAGTRLFVETRSVSCS